MLSEKELSNLTAAAQRIQSSIQGILEAFAPIIEQTRRAAEKFQDLAPLFIAFQIEAEARSFFDSQDIVPHDIFRPIFVSGNSEEEFIGNVRSEWKTLRRQLYQTFEHTLLPTRKVVFNELLKAFSGGCYTIVTRGAIIEIEGIASDFCSKHAKNNQNNRKNFISEAGNVAGQMTPRDLGGMAVFEALEKYSTNMFSSTIQHEFVDSSPVNPALNRHSQAHGVHHIHDKKDALNVIVLLHHFGKFASTYDKLAGV